MIRPEIDALFAKAAPDSVMATGKARAAFGAMRFMPLVSLVWLGWVFGPAVFNIGPSFRHWLWPTLASIPVFLILYCLAYTCPRRQNLRYAIAIALLGAALTPLNPFAETYLIYACAVVACGQSWRQSISVMLAMLAVYTVEWFAIGFPWPYLMNALLIGSIVGIMGIYQNVVHQRQAELRMSHEEVRRLAASAERERIGRDLHDLLGHTLSLVALKSELARRLVERDPRAAGREIADVERIAREALAQVRSAVSGIRSAALASELASAHLLLEAAGVQMGYASDADNLPPDVETCLALVLREAVTNIERHAHAHAVNVTVTQAEGKVRLQIRDDGRGGVSARGNGLNGMRERVQALDGSLTIDSPRGAGTTIDVGLPLPLAAKPVARVEAARTPAPVVAVLPHAGGRRMIRVLLAEDQALVRGALAALLALEPDIEVLGTAPDGEASWREVERLKPDILVSDIEMPGLTGLELAQRIQRHGLPVKVVIVTTFARAGYLRRALDAGVSGYLLKDAPAEKLADSLRQVQRGGRAIDPQLALEAWTEADPLNDRERQVLRLAGEGQSAGDIAQRLNLSHGTVRNYLSEAIGKLGVGNRIEAYRLARQKGWL